jgi:hypothetical protein
MVMVVSKNWITLEGVRYLLGKDDILRYHTPYFIEVLPTDTPDEAEWYAAVVNLLEDTANEHHHDQRLLSKRYITLRMDFLKLLQNPILSDQLERKNGKMKCVIVRRSVSVVYDCPLENYNGMTPIAAMKYEEDSDEEEVIEIIMNILDKEIPTPEPTIYTVSTEIHELE